MSESLLVIHGGVPVRSTPIRKSSRTDLLDHGILSEFYGEPATREFESALARYCAGDPGTSALEPIRP